MTPYQTPQWGSIDRKDHCWYHRGGDYKCLFCGGVTTNPPPHPTPEGWMPDRIEAVTEDERAMVPYHNHKHR